MVIISPRLINGDRQKGAYIRGMKDFHKVVPPGDCPWNGAMMFLFWRRGYLFAEAHPDVECTKGFKEMLAALPEKL